MATYKTSYASLYPTTSMRSHAHPHTHRHAHQKVTITPAPNISTPFVNFTQTPTPTPIYTQTPAPNVLSGVQKDISTTQFWIYKEDGEKLLVHSGEKSYHPLRRFLKKTYDYNFVI